MSNEDVTRNIWLNTVSNYANIILRVILGVFMFRLLYQHLPKEEFGFWALLWSVFGYGILLDFGFGFTAVKRVAELSVHREWDQLSKVLSTIFYFYLLLGILLATGVILGSGSLVDLFKISAGNREYFREILVYFLVGMAITFPLGIFPEILGGQQRMALTNVIFSLSTIGNFILTYIGLTKGWGLKALVTIALVSAILPCVVCAFAAIRHMPEVKIRPRFFSVGMIRETMRFSIYAYVATLSNMILGKTDQLVISTTLTVAAVALYQAGAKLGEVFGAFTTQLPETFSPAAAHLHAKGDKAFLRKLLVDGTRFSVMIATPAYFICAFYMDEILSLLTGDKSLPRETYWVGQVLLLWQYMTVITQSVQKRIFMMCGHEKKLMKLGVGEALLNLALSVVLVMIFKNVLCVAIGSLVSTMVFGWIYVWPWAAREVQMNGLTLARQALLPIGLACLPLIGFLAVARFAPWLDTTNLLVFFIECGIATMVAGVGLWKGALTSEERTHLTEKFSRRFSRRFGGSAA